MIACDACSVSYTSLVFFCPSCGMALVTCSAEDDTVLFRAGSWRQLCVVKLQGERQDKLIGATITPLGLKVQSSNGKAGSMHLFDLFSALSTGAEVLKL